MREHIVVCYVGPARRDVITLRPGHWYGADVSFFLWDDKETGLGPDCFDAELEVEALDRRVAATLPIRVVRTDKPVVPPDGQ